MGRSCGNWSPDDRNAVGGKPLRLAPRQVASSREYVLLCCDDSLYYNAFNVG